jgi:hypothetical protein
MPIQLPKGLFVIRPTSRLSEGDIVRLLDLSDDLYRDVLVLSDSPQEHATKRGVARLNGEVDGDYAFIVFAGDPFEAPTLLHTHLPRLAPKGWSCWMLPRSGFSVDFRTARGAASALVDLGLSAVYHPEVGTPIGRPKDIIFGTQRPTACIFSPGIDDLWHEIFRVCGAYGVKMKIIAAETKNVE